MKITTPRQFNFVVTVQPRMDMTCNRYVDGKADFSLNAFERQQDGTDKAVEFNGAFIPGIPIRFESEQVLIDTIRSLVSPVFVAIPDA